MGYRAALLAAALAVALGGCRAQDVDAAPTLDLTPANFSATIGAVPDGSAVLLEFYSGWCPACQRFQPEYLKAGESFTRERRETRPTTPVYVARVDCAKHAAICRKYGVDRYPTVTVGWPRDVLGESKTLKHLELTVRTATAVRHAAEEAIAELTGRAADAAGAVGGSSDAGAGEGSLAGDGPAFASVGAASRGADTRAATSLADVEGAASKSWEYAVSSAAARGPEARKALIDWAGLLAATHPSPRCRRGAALATQRLSGLWPEDAERPDRALSELSLCPGTAPVKRWESCGSRAPGDTEPGYTCALWQLLHATSVTLPAGGAREGAAWLATVRAFIGTYFGCADCRDHFVAAASTPSALAVADARDAALWLWRMHGEVSARVARESGAAEPPAWPSVRQCPDCREGSAGPWHADQVLAFLRGYYLADGAGGGAARALLAPRSKGEGSSWPMAALFLGAVAGGAYLVIRRAAQYRLPARERLF